MLLNIVFSVLDNSYFQRFTFIIGALVIYILSRIFLNRAIDLIFSKVRAKIVRKKILAKTSTLNTLLKNIVDIAVFIIVVLMILSNLGINIGPILTGAGILGLAFSFGAQSLVKDIISGFFIIWEDQFNVGDRVRIAGYVGDVHKITLRTTILMDKEDNRIFIPNSQITSVVRYQKTKKVKIYT